MEVDYGNIYSNNPHISRRLEQVEGLPAS